MDLGAGSWIREKITSLNHTRRTFLRAREPVGYSRRDAGRPQEKQTQASQNFEAVSGAMQTAKSASRTLSWDQFREAGLEIENNEKGTNLSVPVMSNR